MSVLINPGHLAERTVAKPNRGQQVNFRAPEDLYRRLERIAGILGLDLSNLVRMIIHENLAAYEQRADRIEQDKPRE